MGLDMYAVRRNYVSTWENQPPEERYEVQVARGGEPVREILPERISAIEEEVMYWRKANHIHQWFVDNVQDGNDDCGRYCVSPEQLQALLETCEQVIEASKLVDGEVSAGTVYDQDNPKGKELIQPGKVIEDPTTAQRLLPRTDGFFFGNQQYDEDYLEDVESTRSWLVQTLAELQIGETPTCIVYTSSW